MAELHPLFKRASNEPVKRLVVSIWGEPKTGKSHFALTCPEPIRYLNLDYGLDVLLPKFADKQIDVCDLLMTEEADPRTYAKLLGDFVGAYSWALENTSGGTVVVDTATQVWQLVQMVKLEEIRDKRIKALERKTSRTVNDRDEVQLMQFDYAAANTYMGGLLRRSLHYPDVNVVFIHRCREKYGERGQALGVYEFQGFGETPAITQVTLQAKKNPTDKLHPIYQIQHNRFNRESEGLEFPMDFETLLTFCQPD